jgi:hypothetical protein
MISAKALLTALQKRVTLLEDDLQGRCLSHGLAAAGFGISSSPVSILVWTGDTCALRH